MNYPPTPPKKIPKQVHLRRSSSSSTIINAQFIYSGLEDIQLLEDEYWEHQALDVLAQEETPAD